MEAIYDNDFKKYFKKSLDAFVISETGELIGRSVRFHDAFRFEKAEAEANKEPVSVEQVIRYCNEFLNGIGIAPVADPVINPKAINYPEITRQYQLKNDRDMVWLKFTQDGYVGVVGHGKEIEDFAQPNNVNEYNQKASGNWRFTSSSIILHHLGKRWDPSFVLIFPLRLSNAYTRDQIKTGIGNFLVSRNIPILDFYSYNY